jgi:hypothetical protein
MFVLPASLQRPRQQRVQAPQHALRGVRRLVGQFLDDVQRVEQEVRLQLQFEEVQLRPGQLRLEDMRPQGPVEVPPVRGERPPRQDHGQVRKEVHVGPENGPRPELGRGEHEPPRVRPWRECQDQRQAQRTHRQRYNGEGDPVNGEGSPPADPGRIGRSRQRKKRRGNGGPRPRHDESRDEHPTPSFARCGRRNPVDRMNQSVDGPHGHHDYGRAKSHRPPRGWRGGRDAQGKRG